MSLVLEDALRAHVLTLAGRLGERHPGRPVALAEARDHVRRVLSGYGYDPVVRPYATARGEFANVEARLPGRERGLLVVGAHYDTAPGTPGADDNASGVAVLLELARLLRAKAPRLSIAFAAFSTEEPPQFGSDEMGSRHYARGLVERGEAVAGMLSLEMLGFFARTPGSQAYPPLLKWLYPDRGDFIGLVGNLSSRAFLKRVASALKPRLAVPLQSACLPGWVAGVSLSDHDSFWRLGLPAVMVTDTAFFRNPHYHAPTDLPDTLDYPAMAAVTEGLAGALLELAA